MAARGEGPRSPALYVLRGGGALLASSIVQTLRGAALRHAPRDASPPHSTFQSKPTEISDRVDLAMFLVNRPMFLDTY